MRRVRIRIEIASDKDRVQSVDPYGGNRMHAGREVNDEAVGWAEPAKPNMDRPAVVGPPAVSLTYRSQKNWSHNLLLMDREHAGFVAVIGFSEQPMRSRRVRDGPDPQR